MKNWNDPMTATNMIKSLSLRATKVYYSCLRKGRASMPVFEAVRKTLHEVRNARQQAFINSMPDVGFKLK